MRNKTGIVQQCGSELSSPEAVTLVLGRMFSGPQDQLQLLGSCHLLLLLLFFAAAKVELPSPLRFQAIADTYCSSRTSTSNCTLNRCRTNHNARAPFPTAMNVGTPPPELSHKQETQGISVTRPTYWPPAPTLPQPACWLSMEKPGKSNADTRGGQRFSHQANILAYRAYNTDPLTTNRPTDTQGCHCALQRSFSLPVASNQRLLPKHGL